MKLLSILRILLGIALPVAGIPIAYFNLSFVFAGDLDGLRPLLIVLLLFAVYLLTGWGLRVWQKRQGRKPFFAWFSWNRLYSLKWVVICLILLCLLLALLGAFSLHTGLPAKGDQETPLTDGDDEGFTIMGGLLCYISAVLLCWLVPFSIRVSAYLRGLPPATKVPRE